MKSFFGAIALTLFFIGSAFAQPSPTEIINGSVQGSVLDTATGEPIPYATIVVASGNGETITGGITNDDGSFEITKIPSGSYDVKVQFMGYATVVKPILISKDKRSWDLGPIRLEASAAELAEVNIVAERTTIEQRIDRKVVNVGKDLTTAGATASDIMNNIPSVSVDQQSGALTLRGNANVQVMVDGKLSNIPPDQLLKQIPSTSIKKIELITNPSAKYNPEGMSGIINIVLHKNANIGFNGDVNMGFAYDDNPKFNSGTNLNYRNGKINVYTNYSNNFPKDKNYGSVYRPDTDSRQNFSFLDEDKTHLLKTGLDFYINDKNTASFFISQNWHNSEEEGAVGINFPNTPGSNSSQEVLTLSDNVSTQYNFDYKLDFEKEGHNIELEVDHNDFSEDETANFDLSGNTPYVDYRDAVATERGRTTVNLDYVNPLTENAKLEVGLQAILFNTELDYNSTGLSFNKQGDLVPTPNTLFDYSRDIYSAYVTYGKQFEKWSIQAGVRAEKVEVAADTNTASAFKNDYVQLYPSAYLTYNPDEKNQYQVSYSRRVDRPGIGQVNPIRQWSSPLISNFGNEQLLPQFTNSLEANYTRRLGKGTVTAGVFYRLIEDQINQTILVDRTNLDRIILTFDNFDNTSSYGVEVSAQYKLANWWSVNGSFDYYNQTQSGISETIDPSIPSEDRTSEDIISQEREVTNAAYNVRLMNNFSITKKLSLSAFGMYRGAAENIQFKSKPFYFVNVGARYSVMEGKGTISLNFNDVFNTMAGRFTAKTPYVQSGQFNWESHTVFLGLRYAFGDSKYRAKKRKQRDNNEQTGGGVF